MKHLLFLSVFLSFNSFALDFQKVTGTFDVQNKKNTTIGADTVAQAAYGSFELAADKSRQPASVEETEQKSNVAPVTEITGTFK